MIEPVKLFLEWLSSQTEMPKGSKRRTSLKSSISLRVLLLVKFFLKTTFMLSQALLIQIGSIPIFLMGVIVDLLYYLIKGFLGLFKNSKFQLYAFNFQLKKKGRPKAKPRALLYVKRFYRFFRYRLPLRLKVVSSLAVFLLVFGGFAFFTFKTAEILPSPTKLSNLDQPLTTEFYDRDNNLLYRLYEGRNRSLVKLEELPPYLIQATIAIEDKNFYKHSGLDLVAILRAMRNNFRDGTMQGASTITQQLIKNTLLTPEKTYQRKAKELILALWTERIYSKDEILQMYFNEAPFGGPAWGIEAASQTYFGKNAKDLNLAEATYLAGLPASPTQFSPYGNNSNLSKLRQKQVLESMVAEGYITLAEAEKTYQESLIIKPPIVDIRAPHFVMYLKEILSEKYGDRVVSQGGLKVYTTINLELQSELERIVKEEVEKLANLSVSNGAAMVTDAKTGHILAMVGSKDYYDPSFGNYNVALALRQPGSSIKPVTYAAGFKKGMTPATIILDTPVRFPDGYSPVNYDGRFHGPITTRVALGSSYNIPAVKTLANVGMEEMISTSKDLGITTFTDPSRYGYSLTLGGGEVKMIDMMSVYNSFSQMGISTPTTGILRVEDSFGNTLEKYTEPTKQVIAPEIAYLITHILADNNARSPAFGLSSQLFIPGHMVAVKTGTSDNKRDNWTFGYTPEFVVGVWVGNNSNAPMHPTLTSGVTGAAPIWNRIMKGIINNRDSVAFKRPSGVIDVTVDGRRDLAVAGIIPKSLVRTIRQDEKIIFQDPFSVYATSAASLGGTRN
jgi:1A family penicillin-binding protein